MIRRILSIDGGGIKGTFPASFLATIEESLDRPIGEYFDLIAGTSTGGIIALGLGLGFKASELVEFYRVYGPKIFKGNKRVNWLKHWFGSKYDSVDLKQALTDTFGTRTIGEARTRLVIPSLDLETFKVHIFKTPHHPNFTMDFERTAVEAASATGSAPTYFPAVTSESGIPLVDGGVWANNPISIAAVEGIGVLGWERTEIRILSIGCTEQPAPGGLRDDGGKLYWAKRTADIFMAGQASGSMGMAEWLIGKANIHRINPIVSIGRYELDGTEDIESLRGRGYSEARSAKPDLMPIFFEMPAEPFVPYVNAKSQSAS